MFVLIEFAGEWRMYRIVRGGQPKVGRILYVKLAEDRGCGLRVIRGSKYDRVQVQSIVERDGEMPRLTVVRLEVKKCHRVEAEH